MGGGGDPGLAPWAIFVFSLPGEWNGVVVRRAFVDSPVSKARPGAPGVPIAELWVAKRPGRGGLRRLRGCER